MGGRTNVDNYCSAIFPGPKAATRLGLLNSPDLGISKLLNVLLPGPGTGALRPLPPPTSSSSHNQALVLHIRSLSVPLLKTQTTHPGASAAHLASGGGQETHMVRRAASTGLRSLLSAACCAARPLERAGALRLQTK